MADETEVLKESAKAAQEIAKTAGKAIDATQQAGGWLDRIFGAAIEDTVGRLWTDRVRASRIAAAIYDWERLLSLLHKTEARLRRKGIDRTRIPPPKVILPLLEHATVENEDDLHTLWANLLASSLDPSAGQIEKEFVSALGEMSSKTAHVLRKMFAEWSYWEQNALESKGKDGRYTSGIGGFPDNDETAVIQLYRLGMILPVNIAVEQFQARKPLQHDRWRDNSFVASGEVAGVLGDLSVVAITEFGERLCKAIMDDVTGLYVPPTG